MTRINAFISGGVVVGLIGAAELIGCADKSSRNPMGMDFRDTFGPRPPSFQDAQGRRPVVVGKPNLAYMIDFPCTVRVVNLVTGQTLIDVKTLAGTVVAVDRQQGVYLGERILSPGPLDAESRFAIYLDLPPQVGSN